MLTVYYFLFIIFQETKQLPNNVFYRAFKESRPIPIIYKNYLIIIGKESIKSDKISVIFSNNTFTQNSNKLQ